MGVEVDESFQAPNNLIPRPFIYDVGTEKLRKIRPTTSVNGGKHAAYEACFVAKGLHRGGGRRNPTTLLHRSAPSVVKSIRRCRETKCAVFSTERSSMQSA